MEEPSPRTCHIPQVSAHYRRSPPLKTRRPIGQFELDIRTEVEFKLTSFLGGHESVQLGKDREVDKSSSE